MITPRAELHPHARLLIDALLMPSRCASLGDAEWDRLIRCARSARLLGTIAHRFARQSPDGSVPERVRQHLAGAQYEARYCRQMTGYEMDSVAKVLRPLDMPVVVLKGAAYVVQSLPIADGRMPRDLDLLVDRERLADAEGALCRAGWMIDPKLTAYDQHYYRAWSHELPPLRYPGHAFEVDLHHTILPPIGRLKPDAARLIADSVAVAGSPFRVLRPADQVLHAAVHLFQDSDCVNKLRDLVDIDGLIRHFAERDGERFWRDLGESVAVHGLGRPLWYALAFCRAWLETPIPDAVWQEVDAQRPPAPARSLMTSLAGRVLPPVHPDAEPGMADRFAASLLEFRALWLRMPPWTLAYHGASKALLAMRQRRPAPSAG